MKLTASDFDDTHAAWPIVATYERDGLTIEISNDSDLQSFCPWDDWDCEPPIVWASLERGGYHETDKHSCGLDRFFDHVSPQWVSRHWRAICDALGIDRADHDEAASALDRVRRERMASGLAVAAHEIGTAARFTAGPYFAG